MTTTTRNADETPNTQPDYTGVPTELKELPQWVVWRFEHRGGKLTKVPKHVNGGPASATDPTTWSTFEEATAGFAGGGFDGIGFVFVASNGLVGIDLDKALDETGGPKPWAAAILGGFQTTYAETSPSLTGVKMWGYGTLPSETGRRRGYEDGAVEMYAHSRFFAVTGMLFSGHPSVIAECQSQITDLHTLVFGDAAAPPAGDMAETAAATVDVSDQVIIEKLLGESTDKATRLWSGDTSDYLSQSEADAALACKIAFYAGNDPVRIDRVFRQSMLMRPKWNRDSYRDLTIASAIARCSEFYDWAPTPILLPPPPIVSAGLRRLLEDTIAGRRTNTPWPWPYLTQAAKALLPGTMTVLCGAAGGGKSFFINDMCLAWLQASVDFAVFHLEENRNYHLNRAFAQLACNGYLTDDTYVHLNANIVRAAYDLHRQTLDALGRHIWDAPGELPLDAITDWVRDRARAGARVMIVDPITAADSGREPWHADRKFINDTKVICRDAGASLIVVTHPRTGNHKKMAIDMDNMAGGRAYNRFTQCVLWLTALETEEPVRVMADNGPRGVSTNRIIHIRKARNGRGTGARVAMTFDNETFRFIEHGPILED